MKRFTSHSGVPCGDINQNSKSSFFIIIYINLVQHLLVTTLAKYKNSVSCNAICPYTQRLDTPSLVGDPGLVLNYTPHHFRIVKAACCKRPLVTKSNRITSD